MKRGIKWDEQPLGKVADAELAQRLGVTSQTVGDARRRRGIDRPLPDPSRYRWAPRWESQPLGKMSDGAIARKLGVSQQTVSEARRRRGIGRYCPGPLEAPTPEPVAPAPPEPPPSDPLAQYLARGGKIHRVTEDERRAAFDRKPAGKCDFRAWRAP